jgi:hypothetical protein
MQNPNSHEHSSFSYDLLGDLEIGVLKNGNVKPLSEESLRRKKIKTETDIDMNEAVIIQVGRLGDKYQEWVHIPQTTTDNVYMLAKEYILFLMKWFYRTQYKD